MGVPGWASGRGLLVHYDLLPFLLLFMYHLPARPRALLRILQIDDIFPPLASSYRIQILQAHVLLEMDPLLLSGVLLPLRPSLGGVLQGSSRGLDSVEAVL